MSCNLSFSFYFLSNRDQALLLPNLPEGVHQETPSEDALELPHRIQALQVSTHELWPVLYAIVQYAYPCQKVSIQASYGIACAQTRQQWWTVFLGL